MSAQTALRRIVLVTWLVSAGIIAYLSLLPGIELPVTFWNADKVYHFLAYGWLGALPLWAFARRDLGRAMAYAMVGLGSLLEWGQSFVPGRTASIGDAVANALGVFLGIWLAEAISARLVVKRI
jgi:VanZ family protein